MAGGVTTPFPRNPTVYLQVPAPAKPTKPSVPETSQASTSQSSQASASSSSVTLTSSSSDGSSVTFTGVTQEGNTAATTTIVDIADKRQATDVLESSTNDTLGAPSSSKFAPVIIDNAPSATKGETSSDANANANTNGSTNGASAAKDVTNIVMPDIFVSSVTQTEDKANTNTDAANVVISDVNVKADVGTVEATQNTQDMANIVTQTVENSKATKHVKNVQVTARIDKTNSIQTIGDSKMTTTPNGNTSAKSLLNRPRDTNTRSRGVLVRPGESIASSTLSGVQKLETNTNVITPVNPTVASIIAESTVKDNTLDTSTAHVETTNTVVGTNEKKDVWGKKSKNSSSRRIESRGGVKNRANVPTRAELLASGVDESVVDRMSYRLENVQSSMDLSEKKFAINENTTNTADDFTSNFISSITEVNATADTPLEAASKTNETITTSNEANKIKSKNSSSRRIESQKGVKNRANVPTRAELLASGVDESVVDKMSYRLENVPSSMDLSEKKFAINENTTNTADDATSITSGNKNTTLVSDTVAENSTLSTEPTSFVTTATNEGEVALGKPDQTVETSSVSNMAKIDVASNTKTGVIVESTRSNSARVAADEVASCPIVSCNVSCTHGYKIGYDGCKTCDCKCK